MQLIKSRSDIAAFKAAAEAAGHIASTLAAMVTPGGNAAQLEEAAVRLLAQNRSTAPFKVFQNFGYACCVSINNEVVNGLPTADRIFANGDIVKVAIGTNIRGMHGKAARSVLVGDADSRLHTLIGASHQVFDELAAGAFAPATYGDLCQHIGEIARSHGLQPIAETAGHGIGHAHQQDISLPNDIDGNTALKEALFKLPIQPYHSFVPMPMLALMATATETTPQTEETDDEWTLILTEPGVAAHWAETCWVNGDGRIEILSQTPTHQATS